MTEQPQTLEIDPTVKPRFINLFELTPEEESALKKQVDENRGGIRVLIHPFWDTGAPEEAQQNYSRSLSRLLSSEGLRKVPLIIFEEEEEELEQTKSKLAAEIESCPGGEITFYLVLTQTGRPEPKPDKDCTNLSKENTELAEKNWRVLTDILKRAEVKKILVGGKGLSAYIGENDQLQYQQQFAQKWPGGEKIVVGHCVGQAIQNLAKYFEVDISAITFPHSRTTIKNQLKEKE